MLKATITGIERILDLGLRSTHTFLTLINIHFNIYYLIGDCFVGGRLPKTISLSIWLSFFLWMTQFTYILTKVYFNSMVIVIHFFVHTVRQISSFYFSLSCAWLKSNLNSIVKQLLVYSSTTDSEDKAMMGNKNWTRNTLP